MNVPIQAMPVIRQVAAADRFFDACRNGVAPSRNQLVTGGAVCRKGGSVLWTASETICVNPNHDGCTAAKNAAVRAYAAQCSGQSGTIATSTQSCSVGAKC